MLLGFLSRFAPILMAIAPSSKGAWSSVLLRATLSAKQLAQRTTKLIVGGIPLAMLKQWRCGDAVPSSAWGCICGKRVNALEKANPTLEAFLDLVEALDGEVQIVWVDRIVEKL